MPKTRRKTRGRSRSTRWIIGIAAVAILAVAVVILTSQTNTAQQEPNNMGSCGQPECGQANAPVTIEEYSDFQ